ncbi:MAG: L,D-transpeptidase family protein [Lachnospiraceae bacterium]|nr:L,D-transpeptidase family protein [Lachnospiraceae bacterium]
MKRKFLAAVILGLSICIAPVGVLASQMPQVQTGTSTSSESEEDPVISATPTPAEEEAEWEAVEQDGTTYYRYVVMKDGLSTAAKGLQTIDGKIYYFDENGFMVTGETSVTDEEGRTVIYYFETRGEDPSKDDLGAQVTGLAENGKLYKPERAGEELVTFGEDQYYADSEGNCVKNAVLEVDGKLLLFGEDGKRQVKTGFVTLKKEDGSRIYYVEDGVVSRGNNSQYQREEDEVRWLKLSGVWYLVDVSDGHLLTGWQKVDGSLYYLSLDDGKMQTGDQKKGGWLEIDGSWYTFESWGGARCNCWYKYDGEWYWLHEDGRMETETVDYDGCRYFFESWGGMLHDTWYTYQNQKYYLHSWGGAYRNEWLTVNNVRYRVKDDYSFYANEWFKEDGKYYYFKADGVMYANEWLQLDGNYYYLKSSGERCANEWAQVNSSWYYFREDGTRIENEWLKYDNVWYYLGENGKMLSREWLKYDGEWYFFKSWGGMYASEWAQHDNEWYYFKSWGGMYHDQWLTIDGYDYYFQSWGGRYHDITVTIDGKKYHFDANGRKTVVGWVYIDGYRRYRNEDGTLSNDVTAIFNPSSKYITVDRKRGITTIYGYNSETKKYDTPIKSMLCSVGNPIENTEAGTYTVGWQVTKKKMVGENNSYVCWASYVSQIYGAVYFHGVASDTEDLNHVSRSAFNALGTPQSHGCVRLAACDAKWIYQNVSRGTTVKVGDNLDCPMSSPTRYQWKGGEYGPDPTWTDL